VRKEKAEIKFRKKPYSE